MSGRMHYNGRSLDGRGRITYKSNGLDGSEIVTSDFYSVEYNEINHTYSYETYPGREIVVIPARFIQSIRYNVQR